MANDDDECDSSSLLTVASQSDVTSFLRAQAAKITGLHVDDSDADDGESSIDDRLFVSLTQNRPVVTKPCLSRSCFASLSAASVRGQPDDLTGLQWLSTFKFNENKHSIKRMTSQTNDCPDDSISKLSNELKAYDETQTNIDSISMGVCVFLALYSRRDDKASAWSLTIEQIFEYIQSHVKQIVNLRGWKNRVKQILSTVPCFAKSKHNVVKARSVWTVDLYYRPLLTRAYLSRSSSSVNKYDDAHLSFRASDQPSETPVNSFPPKATVKSKALPRLYEQLCVKESEKKEEVKATPLLASGVKRAHSTSSTVARQATKKSDNNRTLATSLHLSTVGKRCRLRRQYHRSVANEPSTIVTPCPSVDHVYFEKTKKPSSTDGVQAKEEEEDDECDSGVSISPIRAHGPVLRSMTVQQAVHRRKSSPPKKRSGVDISSRRANTRISRKVIEEDLQLLRQANVDGGDQA